MAYRNAVGDREPCVDPKLAAAFERARGMNVFVDDQHRRYIFSAEKGLWLRVGRTPLRVVTRDDEEEPDV
jgi:hypothetical protein